MHFQVHKLIHHFIWCNVRMIFTGFYFELHLKCIRFVKTLVKTKIVYQIKLEILFLRKSMCVTSN